MPAIFFLFNLPWAALWPTFLILVGAGMLLTSVRRSGGAGSTNPGRQS